MKSLYLKILAPIFIALFAIGTVQYAQAAFPGKTAPTHELVAPSPSANPIAPDDDTILLVVLCFLIPPLAVYLKYDEIGKPFWVNVILTLLCGLPGVIHALIHVLKK